MLNSNVDKIDQENLKGLISNAISEGKTIEYKSSLPGNTDKDKKEFLADVSSFANTLGGDLIFGITEENGVAVKIEGIQISNPDAEITKYDNIIRDGIEPRIQYAIHKTQLSNGNYVLILRIKKSWIAPHRVIFQKHDKFYARNSAGKYPLDTMELRASFNLSSNLIDKINQFRIARLAELIADRTPLPFGWKNYITSGSLGIFRTQHQD